MLSFSSKQTFDIARSRWRFLGFLGWHLGALGRTGIMRGAQRKKKKNQVYGFDGGEYWERRIAIALHDGCTKYQSVECSAQRTLCFTGIGYHVGSTDYSWREFGSGLFSIENKLYSISNYTRFCKAILRCLVLYKFHCVPHSMNCFVSFTPSHATVCQPFSGPHCH